MTEPPDQKPLKTSPTTDDFKKLDIRCRPAQITGEEAEKLRASIEPRKPPMLILFKRKVERFLCGFMNPVVAGLNVLMVIVNFLILIPVSYTHRRCRRRG